MPILTKLISKASEKENKNLMWQMWLMRYITMTPNSYIDFEEFYEQSKTEIVINTKTKEEIFAESQKIIEADKNSK